MAKAKKRDKSPSGGRAKLTPEESLKRMQTFAKRKESFIAAVRKGQDRNIPA
jgi:hypothetical protein